MTGFGREALRGLYALDRPEVHWRHDVDYDPACAVLMAELERDCHIRSTFYVMARGPYNPFSLELRKILYGILACGHSLGLHVDLGLPRDAETPAWLLSRAALHDFRLLVSEYPVKRSVTFHAPPRSVYWRDVPGFEHAAHGGFRDRLVSDSRGVWHGDPVELIKGGGSVLVSTHPEWHFWPVETADEWRAVERVKP